MQFSDDDLKRWKEAPGSYAPELEEILLALIARLEAGEAFINSLPGHTFVGEVSGELLEIWRKSKGEGAGK